LVVEEFSVVFDFVFHDVLLKFLHFFEFIVIMFDLTKIKEPSTLLSWLCFLFLFYLIEYGLLIGKNRYARGSNESSCMPWFAYIIVFENLKPYI
jgi:hypothetical protein